MAATNPQMFLAISEYRGKAPEQQAIKEEVLDIDELVNHDDEPVTSENPFSSTSDDVYRWDKVPSWVFRKSRKVSQKRRDLSRAVRIGRNAHKVLGGGRYDLNERKRTRITKENEIKSPKFTNFMTYSPIFGSNGGLYADCPELNLGDSLMSPERKKRVSRR